MRYKPYFTHPNLLDTLRRTAPWRGYTNPTIGFGMVAMSLNFGMNVSLHGEEKLPKRGKHADHEARTSDKAIFKSWD